jgi:small subunit ribosomal protein S6
MSSSQIMFNYELFILISSDIPSQGVKSIFKKISEIANRGCSASFKKHEYLGSRKLAYRIKKYSKARCYIVYFETKPANIPALSSYLKINDGVVRNLITKIDTIPTSPSPLLAETQPAETAEEKDYQKACDGPF